MAERSEQKKKVGPIDEQIANAISLGFKTVLKSSQARDAEMVRVLREISQSTRMMAQVSNGRGMAASVSGMPGALGTPGFHANQARMAEAIVSTSDSLIPDGGSARLDPEMAGAPAVAMPRTGHVGGGAVAAKARLELSSAENTRERIRDRVYEAVASRAEPWVKKPYGPEGAPVRQVKRGYHQDSSGNWMSPSGAQVSEDDAHSMVHFNPGYSIDSYGRPHTKHGKFAKVADSGLEEVSADTIAQVERRRAMSETVLGAAEAWKNGEPVGRAVASMFPAGVLKAAGGAAVAYEGANWAREQIQKEYKANLDYMRVYGGSQTDAMKARFGQWFQAKAWDWSTGLGGETYNELYGQAMNFGLRGGARSNYINQGAGLMTQGVSGQQTEQILGTAVETGQSLSGLVDMIKELGKAAKESSMNAETARNMFVYNYKASSALLLGNGTAAKQMAQAFTLNQVGMGHVYGQEVDYSGTLSQAQQYNTALRLRISPSQLQIINQTNPALGMSEQQATFQERASQLRPDNSSFKQQSPMDVAKAYVERIKKTDGREYEPERDQQGLADALAAAGFDNYRLKDLLSRSGVSVTDTAAAGAIAANWLTNNGPAKQAAELQKKRDDTYGAPSTYTTGSQVAAQTRGGFDPASQAGVGTGWQSTLLAMSTTDKKTGTRTVNQTLDSVTKALMNTGGLSPSTKVEIVAGGGTQVISLSDAITHFQEQIENGSAIIADGDYKGQPVSKILSLGSTFVNRPSNNNLDISKMGIKYQSGTDYFASTAAADAKTTKEGSSTTTNVRLELSREAQQMFQAYVNGSPADYGVSP